MTENLQVYKCQICENIVEVLHEGVGQLVCCGKPMMLKAENTQDASKEKHVPVIEHENEGVKIKVGSVIHPMVDNHHIEWIQIITNGKAYRRFLKPGDIPEVFFKIEKKGVTARAYCDVHGLWKSN